MSLNGEMLEEVDYSKYLESQIGRRGGVEVDVSFRVGKAKSPAGTLRKLWKNGGLGVEAKMLYKGCSCTQATILDRNMEFESSREEEGGLFFFGGGGV